MELTKLYIYHNMKKYLLAILAINFYQTQHYQIIQYQNYSPPIPHP